MVDNDVVMFQVNQQRLHSRTKPRDQDEKGAVAGTVAPTMEAEAWRDRFGSVRGGPVFFEQCCARHYNRGSHEAVLK